MKTLFMLLAVLVLTGCGTTCPPRGCPMLAAPQPMQFTPINTQRAVMTTCTNTAGVIRCVTR